LLAQVAGRAGRGDKSGQVLIQTFTPDHPCITLAAKHDFVSFAGMELAHRREHRYPPYERMARLIVRSEKEDAACQFADQLAAAFKEAVTRATVAAVGRQESSPGADAPAARSAHGKGPSVRLLGPAECPVFRLNNFYRFHFQIQSDNSALLHEVIRNVLAVAKPPSGVEFQVDVDPYSML
jgi:primosomal protein N' (replication factor Y)